MRGSGVSPVLTQVVMNTRLPHTTGDDQPSPGTSVFHSTFSVALQWSGGIALTSAGATRDARNRGTWGSAAEAKAFAARMATQANIAARIMERLRRK